MGTGAGNECRRRSEVRTMQEIFDVGPLLGDAANATSLADLFKPGHLHEAPRAK
jgi:hypothetical protein